MATQRRLNVTFIRTLPILFSYCRLVSGRRLINVDSPLFHKHQHLHAHFT